jgi:phage-related minor tail protein
MQDVVDHLGKLKDGLEEVTTFSSEMQQTIISASNAFTTDFVNSLLAGENALDSFKDFAKNIVSQIIATFLQMAVVNQILNSVFGLTGTNALPTISLGKKAGGGTVQGGSPYMVGERGPEIFVPNTGGTIMNNMNSKNAMGGGTPINIYQNVNFATGVVSTVRAEVTKMMPQIADVTKAAVQESAMRGGNFRRSLVGG